MPFIYSMPTVAEIGEERGIYGKDVADYKGRDSIKENCGVHQNY